MNSVGLNPGGGDPTKSHNDAITPAQPATPSGAASVAKETLSGLTNPKADQSSRVPAATHLSLAQEETKEQAIKNRDGHLWECVDRIPVEEGFIYKFRLRKEYNTPELGMKSKNPTPEWLNKKINAINKKNEEIFPAVESQVERLTDRKAWDWATYRKVNPDDFPTKIIQDLLEKEVLKAFPIPIRNREANEVLTTVGYGLEMTKNEINLYLPDEKVLQSRWNQMKKDHPERTLPELSILSSKDIATDEEFTKAYIGKKMVLSNGTEFVHDHQVHILAALGYMLDDPEDYSAVRERFSMLIAELVEKIEQARGIFSEKISKVGPDTIKENREYCERLQKNMVLADAIPSIVADNLAAVSRAAEAPIYDAFSSWRSSVLYFSDFIENRHAKVIFEKYKKEHNGTEISPAELVAQMEGISLTWLFDQIVKVLDEQDDS